MSDKSKNVCVDGKDDGQGPWEVVGRARRQVGGPGPRPGKVVPKFRTGKRQGLLQRASRMTLGDVAETAASAYKMGKYLVSLINTEMKLFDVTSGSPVMPDYNGTMINLSNVAQGTDYTTRDGDSILMQYSRLSIRAFNNSAATGGSYLRVILLRDNQNDGTDPTGALVVEATGTSRVTHAPLTFFYAQPGNNRTHRFEILVDKVLRLTPTTDITADFEVESFYKGGNKHILFDASAGADASNREGALFLLLLSDQQTNTPFVDYYHRMMFTDN